MNNLADIWVREYDDKVNDEIGLRIQNMRIDRNLTGADIGAYIGVLANQVSRIETGKARCKLEHIYVLCQVLSCSADYLLFGKEEKLTFSPDEVEFVKKLYRSMQI